MGRSDIRIEGYSGDEVVISAKGYREPPERAKGLKPLYNQATDNTGLGLSVKESDGGLRIAQAIKRRDRIYYESPSRRFAKHRRNVLGK